MLSLWFECILLLHSSEVKDFFEKNSHKTLKVLLSFFGRCAPRCKALFDVSARPVRTAAALVM